MDVATRGQDPAVQRILVQVFDENDQEVQMVPGSLSTQQWASLDKLVQQSEPEMLDHDSWKQKPTNLTVAHPPNATPTNVTTLTPHQEWIAESADSTPVLSNAHDGAMGQQLKAQATEELDVDTKSLFTLPLGHDGRKLAKSVDDSINLDESQPPDQSGPGPSKDTPSAEDPPEAEVSRRPARM
ncbi:MAG: hypothetical protein Q9199_005709 [Rusavskia elegans]